MDEQVSWKGQSFTLLVFGGIVFLCSIFFVLGMLVGRGQGERAAQEAAASEDAKTSKSTARAQDSTHTLAPYQGIATGKEVNKEPSKETNKEAKLEVPRDVEPPKASPPVADKPKPASKAVAPPAPAPSKAAPAKAAPAKAPAPVKMIYLQVTALEKDSAANKQAETLRKAGFPAVVMGGDGPNTLYKVQVGPFNTAAEADIAKRKLEALGYKPIRK